MRSLSLLLRKMLSEVTPRLQQLEWSDFDDCPVEVLCVLLQTSLPVRMNMIESKDGQAQKNIRTSHTVNDVDWPGLRAAAVALQSVRLAAIKASAHLPPDEQRRFVERVNKRAYRERWLHKAKVLSKPRDNGSLPLSKPALIL